MKQATVVLVSAAFFLILSATSASPADNQPPPMSSFQRQEAMLMLNDTADSIRKEYFDSAYHGVDFDGRVREAQARLQKTQTLSEAFGIIAWMVDILNDSHTFFQPPRRPYVVEDGWRATFMGEQCFVTAIKSGSDAEAKGLKPGDQILAIEGFKPSRDTWWKLKYMLHTLAPRSSMKLAVVSPGGQPREMVVESAVRNLPKKYDFTAAGGIDIWTYIRELESMEKFYTPRSVDVGEVMIWRLPTFVVEDDTIDKFLGQANGKKALVLDLRGNGGGYVNILNRLLGGVFDHEVKVADVVSRKGSKPQMAKSRGGHAFSGKLVVLVNSGSASASELFARVVQLEKRGVVVGDKSAGAVMEARVFPHQQGSQTLVTYGVEVTVADLKMTDGQSLEHVGVTPDVVVLPTAAEISAGADPQLARAVELAGGQITPAKAGEFSKTIWQ